MFWTIVGAILFVTVGIPIIVTLGYLLMYLVVAILKGVTSILKEICEE